MCSTLRVEKEIFPLLRPFRISRGVKDAAEVVTVTIARDGFAGRGECVPYPRYGETPASVLEQIEDHRALIEAGIDRAGLLEAMPAGAARNAVDCAIWDLELRQAGRDIFEALAIPRPARIATAMTIGLDTPERMREAASALADVPLLKVKVDRTDPAAQIAAVREGAPAPRMIVDPNESWTMDEVDGLQDRLTEWRVDLLEQPLPSGDDEALAGYRSHVPIAADESIHTAADLDDLPDGYGVVNVKLDKTGGLTGALELVSAARARGLGIMTGCMISSSLSIAPAMAIASTSSFVDLDGPLWLTHDRTGGVTGSEGYLTGPEPGFWGSPGR